MDLESQRVKMQSRVKYLFLCIIAIFILYGTSSANTQKQTRKPRKNAAEQSLTDSLIATARAKLGKSDRPGGTGPNSFDCS